MTKIIKDMLLTIIGLVCFFCFFTLIVASQSSTQVKGGVPIKMNEVEVVSPLTEYQKKLLDSAIEKEKVRDSLQHIVDAKFKKRNNRWPLLLRAINIWKHREQNKVDTVLIPVQDTSFKELNYLLYNQN